jgi:hypothetical protein
MIQFDNLEDFKKFVKEKLQETDFAVLADINLVNIDEFISYRNFLRTALINENYNIQILDKPKAIFDPIPKKEILGAQPTTDIPTE